MKTFHDKKCFYIIFLVLNNKHFLDIENLDIFLKYGHFLNIDN